MTALLELREKIKWIYSKNEVFILPLLKFLLAFLVLAVLNGRMGYMTKADNMALVLIAALACSFLPRGFIIFFAAVFSLLHMYALGIEVAALGLVVYALLFLLFFRFSPKDSLVVVLTPLLYVLKIPYIIPLAMGLIGTPVSAVSVGCGVVVYYLLHVVALNAATVSTMNSEDMTAKLRIMVDALLGNKEMLVMIAAFVITVIVVYLIRRMSVDYSWTIAMVAGVMINMIILLVGDLIYETNMSVIGAVFGNLFALAIAKVIEFFRFCVDYNRTEKVQFEDDEYYYYVKAVPKMSVAVSTKTVKHINTQRKPTASVPSGGRTPGASRSVVTERTKGRTSKGYRNSAENGRSVTIGRQTQRSQDNYEELF